MIPYQPDWAKIVWCWIAYFPNVAFLSTQDLWLHKEVCKQNTTRALKFNMFTQVLKNKSLLCMNYKMLRNVSPILRRFTIAWQWHLETSHTSIEEQKSSLYELQNHTSIEEQKSSLYELQNVTQCQPNFAPFHYCVTVTFRNFSKIFINKYSTLPAHTNLI